jgi:hypothetical protein
MLLVLCNVINFGCPTIIVNMRCLIIDVIFIYMSCYFVILLAFNIVMKSL